LSGPTCATKTMSAASLIGRSSVSDASTPRSTTLERKANPDVVDQTAESYAATFDTNVLGALLSLKHELRVMTAQGSGSIVNISSTYGHEGAKGASVYVGSKHAVEGITSAALEAVASGVRVNAVTGQIVTADGGKTAG
jgi:NAD(P)-dependent dehydrogenase (short-subunit alcohol dehydrogenase family)